MRPLSLHPLVLRCLYAMALFRGAMRKFNRRRRRINKGREAFYQAAWRDAAHALGAIYTPLDFGFAEIELGAVRTRVGPDVCEMDNLVTNGILVDKRLTAMLLRREGLPTPRAAEFSLGDLEPAIRFMERRPNGCVVKPAAGTGGGRGVTTGIRTRRQLARASAAAAVYCRDILIEEQVQGLNYRLLYIDGQLVDAFVRQPPTLIGDGRSTVVALVRKANEDRLHRGTAVSQVLLSIDMDVEQTLKQQGLSLRSVPADGHKLILKTVVNENAGAENATVTEQLAPAIVDAGARAAAVLGARLAGVDIITTDPRRPLAQTGGVILEVNSPNFYYHYHKRDGCFPVAEHVLKALLRVTPPPSSRRGAELELAEHA